MDPEPPILFERRGAAGIVTLSRPRALNALDHAMCRALLETLPQWAAAPEVKTVAIRGLGPRAFCAGGDIRAMYESNLAGDARAARFLADEYRLNAMIGAFPKPFVALTHGIVMGGGAGLSVHGRFRTADADLVFAMPESGIGFVTDVGASFFLARCPGESGLYLGLTGARIGLADALSLSLFTHAVRGADHAAVIDRLAEGMEAEEALAPFTFSPGPPPLAAARARIDTAFAAASVEAVLERLDRDGSEFAAATAALMRTRSPSALKAIFRALRQAKGATLRDCLAMEYRVASRLVMAHDFREGVRATLIDKDGRPRWQPASLAAVREEAVANYFAPLGADELSFFEAA